MFSNYNQLRHIYAEKFGAKRKDIVTLHFFCKAQNIIKIIDDQRVVQYIISKNFNHQDINQYYIPGKYYEFYTKSVNGKYFDYRDLQLKYLYKDDITEDLLQLRRMRKGKVRESQLEKYNLRFGGVEIKNETQYLREDGQPVLSINQYVHSTSAAFNIAELCFCSFQLETREYFKGYSIDIFEDHEKNFETVLQNLFQSKDILINKHFFNVIFQKTQLHTQFVDMNARRMRTPKPFDQQLQDVIPQIEKNDYIIVEKANGLRRLLIEDQLGNIYSFGFYLDFDIVEINKAPPTPDYDVRIQSVYDSEQLIFEGRRVYKVYDVMFHKGKSTMEMNYARRLEIIDKLYPKLNEKNIDTIRFFSPSYIHIRQNPTDKNEYKVQFFNAIKNVMENFKYYSIDGVILTPNVPFAQQYKHCPIIKVKGEQISIDLFVRFKRDDNFHEMFFKRNDLYFVYCELYATQAGTKQLKLVQDAFLMPCLCEEDSKSGMPRITPITQDQHPVNDLTVVEFEIKKTKTGKQFIPLQTRIDKTNMLLPNFIDVIEDIMTKTQMSVIQQIGQIFQQTGLGAQNILVFEADWQNALLFAITAILSKYRIAHNDYTTISMGNASVQQIKFMSAIFDKIYIYEHRQQQLQQIKTKVQQVNNKYDLRTMNLWEKFEVEVRSQIAFVFLDRFTPEFADNASRITEGLIVLMYVERARFFEAFPQFRSEANDKLVVELNGGNSSLQKKDKDSFIIRFQKRSDLEFQPVLSARIMKAFEGFTLAEQASLFDYYQDGLKQAQNVYLQQLLQNQLFMMSVTQFGSNAFGQKFMQFMEFAVFEKAAQIVHD